MRKSRHHIATALLLCFLLGVGCANDPLTQQGRISDLQKDKTRLANERDSYQSRYNEVVERNRRQTHEIAASQQKIQILEQESIALKRQLKDTSDQLANITQEKELLDRRVGELSKVAERQEGVDILSNTSAGSDLTPPAIPGTVATVENGQIRIELGCDSLFDAEGSTFTPQGLELLRKTGHAVATQYPGAKVRIEGHVSSFRKTGARFASPMDQSMAQAEMIYAIFTQENIFPAEALRVEGCGVSSPRVSSGTEQGAARNYRIEIVVNP